MLAWGRWVARLPGTVLREPGSRAGRTRRRWGGARRRWGIRRGWSRGGTSLDARGTAFARNEPSRWWCCRRAIVLSAGRRGRRRCRRAAGGRGGAEHRQSTQSARWGWAGRHAARHPELTELQSPWWGSRCWGIRDHFASRHGITPRRRWRRCSKADTSAGRWKPTWYSPGRSRQRRRPLTPTSR